MKKADAIITGDIELRMHTPICRTDDYWATVQRKIKWLRRLQTEHGGIPIMDGGDLFEKRYKTHPSNKMTGWAIRNLPTPFLTIPGNHDLPGKSMENYEGSAMHVLEEAHKLYSMHHNCVGVAGWDVHGFGWDQELTEPKEMDLTRRQVALVHAMVYKKDLPFPGCEGYSAQEMMDALPWADLIIVGHHHATFTHQDGDRLLVNPGSLKRDDADQMGHKPCVFLWYADTNTVEAVPVPIRKNVITRDHIDTKQAREGRLDAFVEKLGTQVVHGINFTKNLETNVAKQPKSIKDKVWKYVEGL